MKNTSKKMQVFMLMAMIMVGVSVPTFASAAVKVKKVTVTSLSESSKTMYVAKGKKVKLSATVVVAPNKSANKKVTYKSKKKVSGYRKFKRCGNWSKKRKYENNRNIKKE